mgnify:FL=1
MEEFNQSTIDPELFKIEDVTGDNACFYRAVANYTYFATPSDKINLIKRFYNWGKVKDIQKTLGHYSETQEDIARFIQNKIVKYVKNNPQEIIPQTGTSIENSIQIVHELTLDEYLEYYKLFAGDIDMDQLDLDEEFIVDRWGSFIEQHVISEIIKCPIIVFNTQKYDKRHNKIINGKITSNKAEKGVRLRVSAVIGEKYLHTKMPIFIIWREYLNNGHYLVCYPKDTTKINEILKLI